MSRLRRSKAIAAINPKKVSETELKLEIKNYKANLRTLSAPIHKKGIFDYCPGSSRTKQKNSSKEKILAIQNLEFPDSQAPAQKNPVFRVEPIDSIKYIKDSSKSTPSVKQRGVDFTSSTNSHYDGWIVTSSPKQQHICHSSSTSTPIKVSSSLTNLRTTSSSLKIKPQSESPKAATIKTVTSGEMVDTHHKSSVKRLNLNGKEWQKPCKESFVVGAPRPVIGSCPIKLEEFSRMSQQRQKFYLTHDPRKMHCLRNPQMLRKKAFSATKEFHTLTKMVKHADNVCAASASESSESFICQEIDLENPMQLDFQGLDYKNTYHTDEQDLLNQRIYHRICRYMDRKRVKRNIALKVQDEQHKDRVTVPACFTVPNRNEVIEPTPSIESFHYGKLFRSQDKPENQLKMDTEHQNRDKRYRHMYMSRMAREQKQQREKEETERSNADNVASILAQKNFNTTVANLNDAFQRSFFTESLELKQVAQRRVFPHTLQETMHFKKALKQQNRVRRDTAKVKQEFYLERLKQKKQYPEAVLEISSDSATRRSGQSKTPSEQSSDDEDDMEVGKMGNRFQLRGFHFKMDTDLRGKNHQKEHTKGQRKEKGCITRDQWLKELAPKKTHIKLDVEVGIEKVLSPDDPDLNLFPPIFGLEPPKPDRSAVQQYVKKRLGRHYVRVLRKNLKLLKPRLRYSVKKFNLISFLYGDPKKRLESIKPSEEDILNAMKHNTTLDYIEAKYRIKRHRREVIKKHRMELLGIPCTEIKKSRLQKLCEQSESDSDSDWVPTPEPDIDSDTQPQPVAGKRPTFRQRGNMPAPKYRESTLRCHPRYPRDYLGERVPSQIFNETVHSSGIPYLRRLPDDKKFYENVRLQKRPYTDMFDARHHHDHWNPTQRRLVDVCYQPEIVTPRLTKLKERDIENAIKNFEMADPPCNAFVQMDLSAPKLDTKALIKERQSKTKHITGDVAKERFKDVCQPYDVVFRSQPNVDRTKIDYPGRQTFLQMLRDVRKALYERKDDKGSQQLYVNKETLIKDLEEDLKSIESCLTSLDSSECTNLTNDSGSFLLMDGKTKVPLDYIRKSLVPFEELQRSRFNVEPIDVDAEETNPFRVLPFSGQRLDQMAISSGKDSFFTFNTRLQNGLRLRLEVPVVDVRKKMLGFGNSKYHGAVTTDIDADYVAVLKDRPLVKMFNFKSGRSFIKDALRLKFESLLIQGQMVRTKIYDRLNEHHWNTMLRTKTLYEKLFSKWEKTEYEAAMVIVYQVKSYYDITDSLKLEFQELSRQKLRLNLDIVFTEGHWINRIMLQNFHYLLADQDWRYKYDWIHRIPAARVTTFSRADESMEMENDLESFEESITKRSVVNIRKRDKDDAWAIKAFYEDVYLKNKQPLLFVFTNADSFLKGIENLKLKTFVLLLELHFTLSIHTELQGRLETFEEWCLEDLKEKEEYVARKCAKKYFMADRADQLARNALKFLDEPIEESFNDEIFNRDRGVITEVWREIVPTNMRGASDQEIEPIEMVTMMSEVVLELISKFELIDMNMARRAEAELRRERAYLRKLSKQAYQVERRIEIGMKMVKRNLDPPFVKPKRLRKLPRLFIKKKIPPVVVQPKHISEHTKFFFRAFHDEGDVMQVVDARESLYIMDTIQEQIVPFYFDHFLKLNGYTPNYNFKTQVEQRDGPELERLQVREAIPEVLEKMDHWEANRKKVMEDNISRNPKMYENINI